MTCEHLFEHAGWQRNDTWFGLPIRKWRCVRCAFTTRTYDSIDRWGFRPIHTHMSVAYPGFNTVVKP